MVQRHDLRDRDGKRMTLITFQDGSPILKDGKIGTEQACCCETPCDLSQLNQTTQPNVSITTNCDCNDGTLNGSYPLLGVDQTGASWTGTTTCDWTGFPSDAPIGVEVSVDCIVTLATYQYPFESLQGSADAQHLTLNQDGYIVGTVVVDLEDFGGIVQCTATVVFGP
jgi:hypothetical protein